MVKPPPGGAPRASQGPQLQPWPPAQLQRAAAGGLALGRPPGRPPWIKMEND